MRIGPIDEIESDPMGTPMIGDLCTEMYHKVERGKPVTALANGIRIIMYINRRKRQCKKEEKRLKKIKDIGMK